MGQSTNFSELIQAASSGETHAQGELHRRYVPYVVRRLRSRARNGLRRWHDTADLAQSVFHEVLRDLPRVEDRGETAFRNWVLIKAENKVRAKYRRTRSAGGVLREQSWTPTLDPTMGGSGPATHMQIGESVDRVQKAMATLNASQREILQLRDTEGLRYAEIAREMGIVSPDAARMQHARALLALRAAWKTL